MPLMLLVLQYNGDGTWEHVQRVGQHSLTGTENWYRRIYNSQYGFYYSDARYKILTDDRQIGVCSSHYPPANYYDLYWSIKTSGISLHNSVTYLNIVDNSKTSVDEFKRFLAAELSNGTPVTVNYIMANSIITQLTLGELKTFPHYTALEQDGTTKTFMNLSARFKTILYNQGGI